MAHFIDLASHVIDDNVLVGQRPRCAQFTSDDAPRSSPTPLQLPRKRPLSVETRRAAVLASTLSTSTR
jgi:hypothetical protein